MRLITRLISISIIILVTIIVGTSILSPHNLIAEEEVIPTPTPTPEPPDPCLEIPVNEGDRQVLLWVSDVQAYAWSDTARYMIGDTLDRGIPLTVSLIPKDIGEDGELVDFLKQNSCNITFAQQGTNPSSEPELLGLTRSETKVLVKEGKTILEEVFETEVSHFVPPQNLFTWQSERGIFDAGHSKILREGYSRDYRGISTYNFYRDELVPVERTMRSCEFAFSADQACVIILYPSAYQSDSYIWFKELLDRLEKQSDLTYRKSL